MKRCISCGRKATKYAEFRSPISGERIVRCYSCRLNKIPYKAEDGFEGP